MFVKRLMRPLGAWELLLGDNWKLNSLRTRDIACQVLLLALGLRSWLLGSATSYYRKPLASLPPPYQLVQGILTHPNIRMTHQQAASESWLGPDAERQSEYST